MALVDRISQMKKEGIQDPLIVKTLIEEGNPPASVSEAFSQIRTRSAISMEEGMQPSIASQPSEIPSPSETEGMEMPEPVPAAQSAEEGMQPSMMQAQQEETSAMPAEYGQTGAYQEQPYGQQQYAEPQYAEGGYSPQAVDIETVRDITKQVLEESLLKLKTQINEVMKLKTELKFEMQDMENRLKKVEDIIQQLQFSIIKKMGDYGEAISGISNEIKATQESFSKMINPILDKKRGINREEAEESKKEEEAEETEESNEEEAAEKGKRSSRKKGQGFEAYLR